MNISSIDSQDRRVVHYRNFSLLLGLVLLAISAAASYFVAMNFFVDQKEISNELILSIPYYETNWQGYGKVFEPIIEVAVLDGDGNQTKHVFLLDSGALVSSLPRDMAGLLGYDSLAMLPRQSFKGFGDHNSFAYQGKMTIIINRDEIEIPVIFTDAVGTKKLLGRAGFMERYSIFLDSNNGKIDIYQKKST